MKEKIKSLWNENRKLRRTIGWILVVIGFLSIITPLTPGGFLFFIGLEILGIDFLLWDKIKMWFRKKKGGGKSLDPTQTRL
jgi:hypothetical protein